MYYTLYGKRKKAIDPFIRQCFRAPGPSAIAIYGAQYSLIWLVRYYPSRNGWVVWDTREATTVPDYSGTYRGTGAVRLDAVFPDAESAKFAAEFLIG